MVDRGLNVNQWQFFANQGCDLPLQNNAFDCGVFVCHYARYLVVNDCHKWWVLGLTTVISEFLLNW